MILEPSYFHNVLHVKIDRVHPVTSDDQPMLSTSVYEYIVSTAGFGGPEDKKGQTTR